MTTPFEREILTHHYTSNAPFDRPSTAYWEIVHAFVKAGLLARTENMGVVAVDEPMDLYMTALANVPLPVKKWSMP